LINSFGKFRESGDVTRGGRYIGSVVCLEDMDQIKQGFSVVGLMGKQTRYILSNCGHSGYLLGKRYGVDSTTRAPRLTTASPHHDSL
jgi:hypothetical protein